MLDDEADIVRVATLDRVKAEAEAKEREAEEVSAEIRARIGEREGGILGEGQGQG